MQRVPVFMSSGERSFYQSVQDAAVPAHQALQRQAAAAEEAGPSEAAPSSSREPSSTSPSAAAHIHVVVPICGPPLLLPPYQSGALMSALRKDSDRTNNG